MYIRHSYKELSSDKYQLKATYIISCTGWQSYGWALLESIQIFNQAMSLRKNLDLFIGWHRNRRKKLLFSCQYTLGFKDQKNICKITFLVNVLTSVCKSEAFICSLIWICLYVQEKNINKWEQIFQCQNQRIFPCMYSLSTKYTKIE